MHAVRVIYWLLKRKDDKEERVRILREAISATSGLMLPLRFISIEDPRREED